MSNKKNPPSKHAAKSPKNKKPTRYSKTVRVTVSIVSAFMTLIAVLLMTAEYDFLRAECDAYAGMLKKAGVPCRCIRYGGIFHGTFDRLGYAPQVEDMLREIASEMRAL